MASRTGKRTYTGIERASAWKQKPILPIPQLNPASTGASSTKCAGHSSCDDPNRWVAATRRAGAEAQTIGDDVDPELLALQYARDGSAAGRCLPTAAGNPGFNPAEPRLVAEQGAGLGLDQPRQLAPGGLFPRLG
jgi:hypothetical protein